MTDKSMSWSRPHWWVIALFAVLVGCDSGQEDSGSTDVAESQYDLVILDGRVYDGLGGEAAEVDIAVRGDRIAALGEFEMALSPPLRGRSGDRSPPLRAHLPDQADRRRVAAA